MQDTGYLDSELSDGLQNSWFGYYYLVNMGANIGKSSKLKRHLLIDEFLYNTYHIILNIIAIILFIGSDFEDFIERNKPVVFTSEDIDPYVCGHSGQ